MTEAQFAAEEALREMSAAELLDANVPGYRLDRHRDGKIEYTRELLSNLGFVQVDAYGVPDDVCGGPEESPTNARRRQLAETELVEVEVHAVPDDVGLAADDATPAASDPARTDLRESWWV